MLPFLIGAGLAGLQTAGVASQNATNRDIAHGNNVFNRDEAAKNRAWLENMSNTAHQREVDDLRAAGLNPLLSANAGASTPGGSTASASGNPTMQNPFSGIMEGAGMLRDLIQLDSTVQQTQADVRVKDAQAASIISNTDLDPSRKSLMLQQTEESKYRSHPNSIDQLLTRYIDRFANKFENGARAQDKQSRSMTKEFLQNMTPEDWSKLQNQFEKSPFFKLRR